MNKTRVFVSFDFDNDKALKEFIIGQSRLPDSPKEKRLLAELLNKNQLYVNLSEIEDKNFQVSKEDKKLNELFYKEVYNE